MAGTRRRSRWLKFSVRFLLMLMLLTAVVAAQYRPRNVDAELQIIQVNAKQQTATVELTNRSHNKVWVYGYAANSPFYSVEAQAGPQGTKPTWQPVGPFGWCGTGAETHSIAKGETVEIEVYCGAPSGTPQIQSLRVSVQVWPTKKLDEEPVTVTSEPFRVSKNPQ